jgi:hypothetical protein
MILRRTTSINCLIRILTVSLIERNQLLTGNLFDAKCYCHIFNNAYTKYCLFQLMILHLYFTGSKMVTIVTSRQE